MVKTPIHQMKKNDDKETLDYFKQTMAFNLATEYAFRKVGRDIALDYADKRLAKLSHADIRALSVLLFRQATDVYHDMDGQEFLDLIPTNKMIRLYDEMKQFLIWQSKDFTEQMSDDEATQFIIQNPAIVTINRNSFTKWIDFFTYRQKKMMNEKN